MLNTSVAPLLEHAPEHGAALLPIASAQFSGELFSVDAVQSIISQLASCNVNVDLCAVVGVQIVQ